MNMQYRKQKKWCSVLAAAAVLCCQASLFPAAPAASASCSGGGLTTVQGFPLTQETAAADTGVRLYGAGRVTAADQTSYDEDCFASYDGYAALTAAQKTLYDTMKNAAHTFYRSSDDADTVSYTGGSMECFGAISNGDASLTTEDVTRVVSMFRNDNPIYFFIGSSFLYSTRYDPWSGDSYIDAVYVSCEDAYTDGSQRQKERKLLEAQIAAVQQQVDAADTALEKAAAAHDWLVENLSYAYDADGNPDSSMTSHSIVGAFDSRYYAAVCEGYAKSFQLLMNAAGVSNFYIVGLGDGGGHAWNMAQMDDGNYYYFDVTWDDTAETDRYFAAGETSFSKNHVPYSYDKNKWEFLYDLPEVPGDAYSGDAGTLYQDGDFTYRLFDGAAVLVAYTGDSEAVTVPDTADGLPVTAVKGAFSGDADLQTVSLPDSVTALSYGDGGTGAFEGCVSLKKIAFSKNLSQIGYHTFRSCSALEYAALPETTVWLGAGAFGDCNSLAALEVHAPDCRFVSSAAVYADTTLYGYSGSSAEKFADKFDRRFVLLESVTTTSASTTAVTTETTASRITTAASSETGSTESSVTGSAVTEPEENYLLGDLDGDSAYALSDLVLMNQYLLGSFHAAAAQRAAMDCYADGRIDARDSQTLAGFLILLVPGLPVLPE